MRYREFVPHPLLRPYIKLIWTLSLDQPADFGRPWKIAPDGIVEVVFQFGIPFSLRYPGESFERLPGSFAISQTRRFVEIRPEGPGGFLSIRFHPWGAYHFFGIPVRELADTMVSPETLWNRSARDLEERLLEAPDDRSRVRQVERFLLSRLRRQRKEGVEPLVRAIWRDSDRFNVTRFCRQIGWGERRLERTFAAALGIPPKSFGRLSRFQSACRRLRQPGAASLTEIAHACGYYDQAHFIADFRAYLGITPGQFQSDPDIYFLQID